MGLYEQIVGANKKKDEEKILGFADNIINSTKVDVNKRYETQKQVVDSISRDLQSALYKENQKNGLFTTPVIPTKKASDFINSAMYKKNPESKENGNEYNPYDVKENAEKFRKSLEATKDISDKLSTERNTLKYDKYLKTAEDVNNEKTTLWDKTGGVVVRGLADLGSSFTIEERKYKDENGNTVFLPSYNTLKQQKVSEDYNTKVGKILGDIGYNTTKILGSTALNAVTGGIGGSALYWQDMAVDNYTNAINQGYEGANAAAYSLVSTGLEYAVGKVLGGATSKLTGGSMRELDTALSNAMNKVIANPTLARIIGTGGSEFTEEFVQEYLDNINKLLILEENTNAKDYVSVLTNPEVLGDALYSGLIGFASGGLVEATNGSDVNRNIKMFTTFKEQLEQRKVGTTDTKTKEQIDEIIKNIDGYLENPFSIDTKTIENTQNNIINLPTAQNTQTTSIEDLVESSSSRKSLESLQEQNNANLQALLEQQRTLNESKLQEIENEEQRIKNQQLLEETNKRIAELEAEMKELVPTANTEGMNLQESAERYGLNANSTPVKTIQLMLENRGINARFDSTPFKNSSTNAIWSKDGNGNRSVIFNPKASPDTVLENIAIHELTHDLMSSVDSRKALRTDDLLSYVKSLEGYQEARNDLIHTYSAMYNPNSDSFQSLIDEEVVADVLGRRLGNQEFVTRLVNQKPSIARSIYNWVVDKLNSIVNRGGNVRNEKLYWESLKNRFENAYNMSYNSNTEAGTRYATVKNNPYGHIKEFVKMKQEQQEEAHRVISPLAAKYAGIEEAYSATDINGNTYDFEIFEDGNYRVTKIQKLKDRSKEVSHETNPNTNSRYSMESSQQQRDNDSINNQSNRNNGTSTKNVKISTREQGKSQNRLSNQTQNGNNRELNSSFSNAKINDYEQMQNEIKSQIGKAYKIDEDFGKNMEKQYKEYREKNQLQYEILKNTKSRQAQNVNDDFFKEHESDYDGKSGTKTPDGKVTSIKLQKGDNLAKLSYTENADKIWIDELYVKNQNQGFGSEIVNAIKEYAERNGKDVEAFKELSTAKGFWDKTLRKNNAETRYSKEAKEWNEFLDKNVSSTGTTGTLMAIHNLGEKKLKGILELGGIPVPSIAVTNPNLVDHSSYGNISLIFNKNTIDPSNKENEVYDRDVWSPTQPQIDYYIDSETLEKVANKLGIRDYDLEDYADNNKTPEYLSDRLTRVDEIVDKYVTDNNIKYETAYKTPEMRVEFHELSEDIKQFIKNNDLTVFKLAQDENLKNEYYRLIKDYYDNANFPQQSKEYLYKEKVDFLDKWLGQQSSIDSTIMRGLQRYQDDFDLIKKGENKVVDEWQTEKNKRQAAIDNGLQEYLIQETAPLFKEKGIYNGKEYLTSSGRRRSFWELHDEYNLENIVDAMTKGSTKGTQNWVSGFGQIQAQMANRFNSLSEIKNAESQIMPDANNTRLVELREKLESDIDNLSNKYDGWGGMEIASELIADFASQTNHDIETFRKLLNENYQAFGRINDNEINQIIEHLEELRDLPTDYFEANPQRAVDLDEIEVVVIPNNTAEEIREQLKTAGLDFVEYNPDVEGDRQRVINKFDNLKFSKNSNGKWQDFVNKHFESKGTTTRLGDIKLPTKQQPKIPTKQVAKKPTTNQTKLLPTQPIKKETQKTTIPMAKKDDVIKVASQKIAKQINSTGGFDLKQRSWVGTSTESEILKNKVYIDDLDVKKINYVVQSNKKSLDNANNRLKNNGYEKTLDYVKSIMQSDKLPSASDVALMQRMIQEASKKGDAETVQDLIMNTAIIGTDLGQATQALSIIQRLTPEGQLKMYTKLVQRAKSRGEKSFQNVEITPEMVQNVLEAYKKDGTYDQDDLNNRVEKFKQSIANQMKTTAGEKIDAWRYLSMLGNPKTHIRNMVSNVAMRGTIKVKNAMARTLETILPVKDRTKTWKKASNEVQNFAEQTANEMKGIITGENKYNEKSSIESKKQIFKNKALEKLSNFNSNALEAEDWFFSKKAFKDTLQEYLTAKGINTKVDIENNSELVEKAKLYAVEQAEIATFRQYSKLASMIGQFQRKSKFGRIAVEALMPFKKTPVNVAKAGVSYSPIGLLKNISYDVYQLKQGNINASQFIDNLAQGLTGTSLTLLGYALAKSGVLSGSGGDDKDDKYDKQLGKTGYSLNIGGNSYSISWLSPVAMPLLVGSNAYEQLEEDKEWDMNVVSDTLAKTLDPLNEMSFMQGLTNALQSYGSGADKIKGSLESTAQNYVGQFFPTLFSQLAATTDDKKRSTKASNNSSYKFGEQTIRSIMYKVPGLRQQLEVATDIWGNEKEQSENILQRAFESFIAPYSKNKDISTNLDKEIKRVYNETGESGVIPNIPYAYTKYDGETYKMSAKEYTDFKKTYGQTANSTLNKLINSADYKEATDEDKAKMIDSVYDYARAKANEEYFDNSDTNYENKMIDKLDTLKSNYGISADTYFANKKEYDYAYQNPDKYSVIRQIAKYDKYTTYKNEITDIRNNTSNDKIETIKYINSLNMNIPQKAMFIKQYYKSFKQYDSQIIQYINNQKLTSKEKEQILTQLGFTIKDGRVYY